MDAGAQTGRAPGGDGGGLVPATELPGAAEEPGTGPHTGPRTPGLGLGDDALLLVKPQRAELCHGSPSLHALGGTRRARDMLCSPPEIRGQAGARALIHVVCRASPGRRGHLLGGHCQASEALTDASRNHFVCTHSVVCSRKTQKVTGMQTGPFCRITPNPSPAQQSRDTLAHKSSFFPKEVIHEEGGSRLSAREAASLGCEE